MEPTLTLGTMARNISVENTLYLFLFCWRPPPPTHKKNLNSLLNHWWSDLLNYCALFRLTQGSLNSIFLCVPPPPNNIHRFCHCYIRPKVINTVYLRVAVFQDWLVHNLATTNSPVLPQTLFTHSSSRIKSRHFSTGNPGIQIWGQQNTEMCSIAQEKQESPVLLATLQSWSVNYGESIKCAARW